MEKFSTDVIRGLKRKSLLASIAACILLSSVTSVDRYAEEDLDTLFRRALVTFALARTLNGLISVVQGTELELAPAGVGVTLTPGQILDPVNDLVERFSWIMLGASISLGVQQVLLDIGQWWGMRVLVVLAGLLFAWEVFRRADDGVGDRNVMETRVCKIFLVMLFLRFAVPATLVANEVLFELFLEPRYQESTQVIEAAGSDIEQAVEVAQPDEGEGGITSTMGRVWESARDTLDLKSRVNSIKARAADVIEHVVQLSALFVLQTALLPLFILWLIVQLLRRVF